MGSGTDRERVLVVGDDMRIFLAVVRSLGRAGKEVHAAPFDPRAPALRSRYIAKIHGFPRYSENPAAWLASVQDTLSAYRFDLVVPCCDRAIHPLHAHRDALAGHRLAIPPAEAMDLLFDKERTRRLSRDLGIPVAPGDRLRPGDTAAALAERFGLPLVLKPRSSYWLDRLDATDKVWIADTLPELEQALATIQEPARYLAEGYFDGVGIGVSVLAHDGAILQAFQHRRLRQGRGGSSSFRVSEAVHPELYAAAERICAHTRLTGVCMFEFRFNPHDRSWILLETNARFWGSSPLPISLGVDFPRFLFDLLVHGVEHPRAGYPAGVRSRNFVLDGYNLLAGLSRLRRNEIGRWAAELGDFLAQPVRWASGQERSDSFDRDDPWPALSECAVLWKGIAAKLARPRPAPRRDAGGLPDHAAEAAP